MGKITKSKNPIADTKPAQCGLDFCYLPIKISSPETGKNQEEYKLFTSNYFNFLIKGHEAPLDTLRWPSFWDINHKKRLLVLSGQFSFDERTKAIEDTLCQGYKDGKVEYLREWGNVLIPIILSGEVLLNIDLCGVDIFGIIASTKIKQPFPEMLDNTIATNLTFGQEPLEMLIQKALEEASIPETYTRTYAIKCGITNNSRLGCQRHIQHIIPTPANSNVKEFRLISVKEVTEALVYAYFVRHGIINANNKANLEEVCARLHQKHDPVII
ncbi:hypothetical protein V2W45_1465042 [Cenococcum geophilum]